MHASTAPCSKHYSANANHLESASQTRPRRRTILPASSPNPPIIGQTGEAKAEVLLPLGCVRASSPVRGSFCDTHTAVDVQSYDQSLVDLLCPSSSLASWKCIASDQKFPIAKKDATYIPNLGSQATSTINHDTQTFVSQPTLDDQGFGYRHLTRTIDIRCSMTSTVGAPGTPPELTESRSSKSSSSSCASDFSIENELAPQVRDSDIINFEDIALDSDVDRNRQHGQVPIKQRSPRETFHARRSTLPNINCQARPKKIESTGRSNVVGPMTRGFTSPSIHEIEPNSRPRSISPPKRISRSLSSYSINMGGSISGSPHSSITHSRRGSWQPQRKTIKEIEAEYHDSDDELPDDANLWNVPISPSHSANMSRRSSFRGSPDRDLSVEGPQPLPLEHVHSAPQPPPRRDSLVRSAPGRKLAVRSSSANPSRSSPTSPRMPRHMRNGRAKSWNLAMSDLSDEARIITENLESYTSTSKIKTEDSKSSPSSTIRTSTPKSIQLPPIQRGTLDFMPISKEKEAVLSRTRPSWLPPKDPKEEQKHLKEYQRMMAASIEAEKKREDRLKSAQSEKDITLASLNRIWDFYINPTTDITVIDQRVSNLCWRGIPSRVRGKVWQRAVGNPLGLTVNTYERALERAKDIKAKTFQDLTQLERTIASWFADIERDAETAFPELGFYQRNGPFWQDLINVCEAYACYRSDTGYFYGIQLIGALALLQLPDAGEAFVFMANCLNKPTPQAFHTCDIASAQKIYNRVISNLGVKFPRLHDYLFEPMERGGLGFTAQEVFEPMFRTLFSNGLDFDRLCRVWDIWIFEGDRTLARTAVALLGSLQSQIFDVAGDVYLKRRNVQEMLGWGPFNRSEKGGYWRLDALGNHEAFVDEIDAAGKLDYTGH